MNHCGIGAIRRNARRREIDEVPLHTVVRHGRDGIRSLANGKPASCVDAASLIESGDTVWVTVADGPGRYKNTDHVGIKRGRHERLYSCTKDATPTPALIDLPRYRLPDDPPARTSVRRTDRGHRARAGNCGAGRHARSREPSAPSTSRTPAGPCVARRRVVVGTSHHPTKTTAASGGAAVARATYIATTDVACHNEGR